MLSEFMLFTLVNGLIVFAAVLLAEITIQTMQLFVGLQLFVGHKGHGTDGALEIVFDNVAGGESNMLCVILALQKDLLTSLTYGQSGGTFCL